MRTGNVIRAPGGDLWIVVGLSGAHDEIVEAISFDSENVSATQKMNDHWRRQTCGCEATDPLCEQCGGTGSYEIKIKGWKHSKVLAPNVKEFILRGVQNAFGMTRGAFGEFLRG